jgi:hypothetical protein
MSLPIAKFAVYYGTIRLRDGTLQTYSAAQIAAFYNVSDQNYLAVALTGVQPFQNGRDYMSYFHLKPLPDGQYYDAKIRYNIAYQEQLADDFVVGQGKWARRPTESYDEEDIW